MQRYRLLIVPVADESDGSEVGKLKRGGVAFRDGVGQGEVQTGDHVEGDESWNQTEEGRERGRVLASNAIEDESREGWEWTERESE